jgi:hypothetical protein
LTLFAESGEIIGDLTDALQRPNGAFFLQKLTALYSILDISLVAIYSFGGLLWIIDPPEARA